MTMCFRRRAVSVALVLAIGLPSSFAVAGAAARQQGAWDDVSALRPGVRVWVETSQATTGRVSGKLVACDPAGITVQVKKSDRRIARDEVRKVQVQRGNVFAGMVVSVVGIVVQLAAAVWAASAPEGESRSPGLLGPMLMIGGALVALVPGTKRTVYEASFAPSSDTR